MPLTRQMFTPERVLLALLTPLLTYLLYEFNYSSYKTSSRNQPLIANHASSTRFAILSMTTSETSYDYFSVSNKHQYAAKHGYDMIWDFAPSLNYPKVWDKLNMSRDAIQHSISGEKSYEWVWMLDYDTLITNTSITLETMVTDSLLYAKNIEGKNIDDIHLILTRDCDPLNLGSMFLRAAAWTLEFIEQWRSLSHIYPSLNEQEVLRDMLATNTFDVNRNMVLAPQHYFDAYPEELDCYDPRDPKPWEEGMFVIHFAGANWRMNKKDAVGMLMRKYSMFVV